MTQQRAVEGAIPAKGVHADVWDDAMGPIRQIVSGQRPVAGLDDDCVTLARLQRTSTENNPQRPANTVPGHHQRVKEQEQHR